MMEPTHAGYHAGQEQQQPQQVQMPGQMMAPSTPVMMQPPNNVVMNINVPHANGYGSIPMQPSGPIDPLMDPSLPGVRIDWIENTGQCCTNPEFTVRRLEHDAAVWNPGKAKAAAPLLYKGEFIVPLCGGDVTFQVMNLSGGLYLQNMHRMQCCESWWDIVWRGAHAGTGRIVSAGCCKNDFEIKDPDDQVLMRMPAQASRPCCSCSAPFTWEGVAGYERKHLRSLIHFHLAGCCTPAYVTIDFMGITDPLLRMAALSFACTRATFIVQR
ncbi:unnamed protein product [Amoebophrya sp. A25]|nr:unnamed protein product [Amoebophrya sp. A25]|eukprot:GSA25T00010914001.1